MMVAPDKEPHASSIISSPLTGGETEAQTLRWHSLHKHAVVGCGCPALGRVLLSWGRVGVLCSIQGAHRAVWTPQPQASAQLLEGGHTLRPFSWMLACRAAES